MITKEGSLIRLPSLLRRDWDSFRLCRLTVGKNPWVREQEQSKKGTSWVSFFCGETGIRTQGTRKSTPHFECGPFDHSGISPFSLRLQRYKKMKN